MLDPTKTTLPRKWALELTMALRSRDVTGAAIGDTLRAAEAYCADSGLSPEEAFGPAGDYADSLTDLPTVGAGLTWTTRIAPSALGLAGLLLALPTFDAWRAGRDVQVTLGTTLAFAFVMAVVLAVTISPRLYRRRVWFALVLTTVSTAALVLNATLTPTAMRLPVLPSAVLAAAALIGSGLWQMRVLDPDVIADPLEPPSPARGRAFALVTAWLFPLGTLVALAVGMLIPVR